MEKKQFFGIEADPTGGQWISSTPKTSIIFDPCTLSHISGTVTTLHFWGI